MPGPYAHRPSPCPCPAHTLPSPWPFPAHSLPSPSPFPNPFPCGRAGGATDKLEQVAKACRDLGAATDIGALDVTDANGMATFLIEQDTKHQIDLVIANAGVSAGMLGTFLINACTHARANADCRSQPTCALY